jgi:hypothetical protein
MAADELPLRTDAYALPAAYAGNAKFPGLGAVDAPADAPTEIVTITCADTDTLGGERWGVSGSVSGAMPDCVTGTAYQNPRGYGFTVPRVLPPPARRRHGADQGQGHQLRLPAGRRARRRTVRQTAGCRRESQGHDGRGGLHPKTLRRLSLRRGANRRQTQP